MSPRILSTLLTIGSALSALCITGDPAHAAVDPLCGTTITSNLTLTTDVDCTGYTGASAITIGANNVTIDGAGYTLRAPDAGRAIYATGRTNIAVKNIDVSGWCGGNGIYIDTSTTVLIQNVVANGRVNGVQTNLCSALTVQGLTADGNSTNGLYIYQATTAVNPAVVQPVLQGLTLTNNITALRLRGVSGITITKNTVANPTGTIVDTTDSATGINFEDVDTNITVDGLTLKNRNYGIYSVAGSQHRADAQEPRRVGLRRRLQHGRQRHLPDRR